MDDIAYIYTLHTSRQAKKIFNDNMIIIIHKIYEITLKYLLKFDVVELLNKINIYRNLWLASS